MSRSSVAACIVFLAIAKSGYTVSSATDSRSYALKTVGHPPASKLFFGDTEVVGADLKTFKPLANCPISAKDKNAVYIMGVRFTEPDPASFQYLGSFFFSDDHHVYFTALTQFAHEVTPSLSHLHVLKGFDAKEFHEENGYWQDEKTIVVDLVHHLSIRKSDFKNYGAGYVGDGTHVYTTGCYTSGLLITDADVNSFKGLDHSAYAIDDRNAYWCGLKVGGSPDLETFHLDATATACDKLGCFQDGHRKT